MQVGKLGIWYFFDKASSTDAAAAATNDANIGNGLAEALAQAGAGGNTSIENSKGRKFLYCTLQTPT